MLDTKIKKLSFFSLVFALFLIIPGCTSHDAGNKAFTYLEKAASKEDVFNQQQKPLIQEEKDEQDLYQKIMALDMTKYDQIKDYSEQALKHVDARQKLMDKEKQSIEDAYKTFKEAVPYLKKIDNKDAKGHAEKVIDDMTKRYNAFEDLYSTYKQSVDLDHSLFTMLKDKNLTKDDLTKQLNKVNAAYEDIEKHKDTFNQLTQSFNDEKKSLYKILKLGNS